MSGDNGGEHDDEMDPLSPEAKPAFLRASDPSTWAKPDDVSWGDYSIDPSPAKPLNARQLEVARLLFLGKSQTEVAATVGYTIPWVNRLTSNSKIKSEIERLRDMAFERTIDERLKALGPASMDAIEQLIKSDDEKLRDQAEMGRWIVE